ncbi:MAG: glycosyltransferase [Ignavibacteriae bacterium]|nr:glycosyltransferase [Ignavibacteriota bacterium]
MNVLIIAYNFPPEGGPAVQRISKFVKYLIQLNAKVFVLTAAKKNKIIDNSLFIDIEKSEIYKSYDLGDYVSGDLKKIFKNFFTPDKSALWKYTAVKKGLKIIKEQNIELIFSTSPPHSTQIIAEQISLKSGIKWVADFRDEWVDNSLFHKAKLKDLDKIFEKRILENCTHITTITNKAKQNFSQRISSEKITVIRNGYDEDDFKNLNFNKSLINSNILNISYAGRLNELHSPNSFFKSLSILIKSNKINSKKISVTFIGGSGNEKWLKDYPELNEIIKFVSYLPHDKMLLKLNEADVLLLFATNMNITELFPAKMFEYFRLRKSVFAIISSEGELSETLIEYGNSYIAIDSNLEEIQNSILKILANFENNNLVKSNNQKFIQSFERKKQAEQLYNLFQNILKD